MTGILVRPARGGDLERLVEFNQSMALETEGKRLPGPRLEQGMARALADRLRGRYFVAERGGAVVGCLMLTLEWSDWRDGWFWWIQSVYVDPDARRQGVYRALYEHVLEEARASADVVGVRLYVEGANATARAVYERLGMSPTSYRLYEVDFRDEAGE